MISRQIGATLSVISGPGLTAFRPSITSASRSGRKATVPSRFFTSPTALASAARRLSVDKSSRSIASICWRSARSSGFGDSESAMALGEFLQVVDQGPHALHRHRVVDRGAQAADALVALQAQQSACLGALEEGLAQRLVAQEERHVHARTPGRRDAVLV